MANDIIITKLVDGPRNAIFHITLTSDGQSGDLVKTTLIDPHFDFNPELPAKPILTIEEIWYEFAGFTARLQFSYLLKDTPVWTMNGNASSHICFDEFGGIKDRSNLLDGNGKLTITTSGFGSVGNQGTIVLKVRKN